MVLKLAEDLIANPVLTASKIDGAYQVTYPPAAAAASKLVKLGVLREVTGRFFFHNGGRSYRYTHN